MWHKFESEVNWSAFGSFDGSFFLPPRNIVMSWVLAGKGPRTYARLLTMACPVVVWGVVETLAVDPIVVEMGRCLSFMIVVEFVFQVILPYTAGLADMGRGIIQTSSSQRSVWNCETLFNSGVLIGGSRRGICFIVETFCWNFVELVETLLKLCWIFVETFSTFNKFSTVVEIEFRRNSSTVS